MNYQKIILIGNVVADAQKKQSKNGGITYAHLRVAVNDRKNKPTFFPVTTFGKLAEAQTKLELPLPQFIMKSPL